jgi:hypothetical protein
MKKNSSFLLLALTLIIGLSSYQTKAYGQVSSAEYTASMWKYFFPKADCQQNECARGVPFYALEKALLTAKKITPTKLTQKNWMMVIDFSYHSLSRRAFLINLRTGQSQAFYVSHGLMSDNGGGYATNFSNTPKSKMSSLGLYVTGGTYHGKHGNSLILNGLQKTNSNAATRKIVMHPADYMNEQEMFAQGYGARSEGCPAFEPEVAPYIISKLKGGSIVFIYAPPVALAVP